MPSEAPPQICCDCPNFMRNSASPSMGLLRLVKMVSPMIDVSFSMPVCPKIVAPMRYLPSRRGTNAPIAHRHSLPTPMPEALTGSLIELRGRK